MFNLYEKHDMEFVSFIENSAFLNGTSVLSLDKVSKDGIFLYVVAIWYIPSTKGLTEKILYIEETVQKGRLEYFAEWLSHYET